MRGSHLAGIITESDIFEALLGMSDANTPNSEIVLESNDVNNTLVWVIQLSERHTLPIQSVRSFRNPRSGAKIISVFHFPNKPDSHFVRELCQQGIRLLSLV